MIVIESGGTKSTWAFLNSEKSSTELIETVGLHPREINSEKFEILERILKSNKCINNKSHIYFYGAGCENKNGKETIKEFFNSLGFNKVSVETDLKGACLALLGNNPGFIGILGTGAVAAQFDGQNIIKKTSGLGHIMGDEGSGFDIGKRLLNGYFNEELPVHINKEIEEYFSPETDIIHRIYQSDGRKIIAGLTHIVKKYSNENEMKTILESAFRNYYISALKNLHDISEISFVGSVAYHFENELKRTLLQYNISIRKIQQSAIIPLFHYHSDHIV